MSEDKAKETAAYLEEWLRREQTAHKLVPEVERELELARWGQTGSSIIKKRAPQEITRNVEQGLARDLDVIKKRLPLVPDYGNVEFYGVIPTTTGTSTASAASSSAVFIALTELHSPDAQEVDEAISEYLRLQEKTKRIEEAKQRLRDHFPSLALLLDSASDAFAHAKVNSNDVPKAAAEIRTFLDKLQGELYDKARRSRSENMGWSTMAERLTPGLNSSMRPILLDQEMQRRHLYAELTDLFKGRGATTISRLSQAWAGVVDHIYVTCGCLS